MPWLSGAAAAAAALPPYSRGTAATVAHGARTTFQPPARAALPACLPAQLPKIFELVGLGYSAWFTYRYLLFKSSREELVEDIEGLKKKIRCGRAELLALVHVVL